MSEQNLKIRIGNEEDIASATEIAKENNLLSWAGSSLKLWNKRDNTNFVVIEREGKIIGFLLTMTSPDGAELLTICISKEFQNQGYGRKLLEYTMDLLKEQDVKVFMLETDTQNEIAKSLYHQLDFKDIATRKNYYDGKRDAVVMKKIL